jgi:3-hydroxyisobutyrate dehydrogenase
VPVELSAVVEQVFRRARATYGDQAGEMTPFKLYEDMIGRQIRLKETRYVGIADPYAN